MLSGLVSAIRTLTIFSVPGKDAENFSSSLYWFPVVGAFLGTLLAACAWLPLSIGWSELASAVVVVGGFIVSRGMHADAWPIWLTASGAEVTVRGLSPS